MSDHLITPRRPRRGQRNASSCAYQRAPRTRDRLPRRCKLSLVLGLLLLCAAPAVADDPPPDELATTYCDPARDWLLRPTDPGGNLPFNPTLHPPVDLLELTLGKWRPDDAFADLFDGRFLPAGKFVRLDVMLAGLVNPPGGTHPDDFQPFQYGNCPVFGFIEFDMDEDVETGGELDAPQYRYVGNAVRFGSKPSVNALEDRIALGGDAFDGDFETPPFVDRSGEEFHLALLGSVFTTGDITEVVGNGDFLFEAGEVWRILAPWFHRAHGYEPFSLAQGGGGPGVYEPACVLQFAHDVDTDTTLLSLIFPLTNEGAAEMWDEPVEPPNADPSDQFSIHEGLDDLRISAQFIDEFPTGLPEEEIILGWQDKNPMQFMDPGDWAVNAILGTSYTAPPISGEYFIWTDIYPDGARGDVNGDGDADAADVGIVEQFITDHDDDDGLMDGQVTLLAFPVDFSVYDINHSGVADPRDTLLVSAPRDFDYDTDVDLRDFAALQIFTGTACGPQDPPTCVLADLDLDGDVDAEDWWRFSLGWTGPGGLGDPDGAAPAGNED